MFKFGLLNGNCLQYFCPDSQTVQDIISWGCNVRFQKILHQNWAEDLPSSISGDCSSVQFPGLLAQFCRFPSFPSSVPPSPIYIEAYTMCCQELILLFKTQRNDTNCKCKEMRRGYQLDMYMILGSWSVLHIMQVADTWPMRKRSGYVTPWWLDHTPFITTMKAIEFA